MALIIAVPSLGSYVAFQAMVSIGLLRCTFHMHCQPCPGSLWHAIPSSHGPLVWASVSASLWVGFLYRNIEEEMVGLLQIAMVCASTASDQRPKMSQVVKVIEEIRPESESPHDDPGSDSQAQSPLSGGESRK